MKWTWALPAITALCFASGGFAQDRQTKNPREGDPQAIRNGTALYRIRCSGCHGMDATGLRGPDLTSVMSSGITDEQLFQYVKRGVPGTEMPPTNAPDDEIWQTLAYLRTLSAPAAAATAGGADEGNSDGERVRPARVRRGHAGDARRPAHPRHQEERGRLLHTDHGPQRAAAGTHEVGAARDHRGERLADARLRRRQAARRRLHRSARVPEPPARDGRRRRVGAASEFTAAHYRRRARRRPEGFVAMADVRRRLRQPAPQSAHADHAGERAPSRAAMELPDRDARPLR